MTREEFIALYEKCMSADHTDKDLELLAQYQDDFKLTDGAWLPEMGDKMEVKAQIYNNLQTQINPIFRKRALNYRVLALVASILVFFTIGLFFFLHNNKPAPLNLKASHTSREMPITPGSNKAILTLANGQKINLDDSKKGFLSKQGIATIEKSSGGNIVYKVDSAQSSTGPLAYNLITTPRGGQYQLKLADGTAVWLNAASSLKYPTVFSGQDRTVELTGEAYFEVTKNADKPFIVSVNGMSVRVLGTHFNIMAYNDENVVETTLLEGSVKLIKNNSSAMLMPGQQGSLMKGNSAFKVEEVNIDDAVAWKNGFFSFENEHIESIMRQISRWYDVDVEYKGNLAKQNYGGSVSRFKDISELLKTLELTGTIHFKIEGRRVTVMP